MKVSIHIALLTMVVLLMTMRSPVTAMELALSFDEVVQGADLVFVGEVLEKGSRYTTGTRKEMILTDYSILVRKVIASKSETTEPVVKLTFAGGKLDKEYVVSGVPTLEVGGRYLLFTRHDGKVYANPLIGGHQGLFPLVTDEATGVSYPVRNGKHPITGVDRELSFGRAIKGVRNGMAEEEDDGDGPAYYGVAPVQAAVPAPADQQQKGRGRAALSAKAAPSASAALHESRKATRIMNLDEFAGEIARRRQP